MGKKNNVSNKEKGKLVFFSAFKTLNKRCNRSPINTVVINANLKLANKITNGQESVKKVLLSDSFRVNIIYSIVLKTGNISVAQSFLRHENIATTALYDRKDISNKDIKQLSEFITNPKQYSVDDNDVAEKERHAKVKNVVSLLAQKDSFLGIIEQNQKFETFSKQELIKANPFLEYQQKLLVS